MRVPPQFASDVLVAGNAAAVLSGIPSTVYAGLTGRDMMEATRAAGAMLIPAHSSDARLLSFAALVHVSVSTFWATVLTFALPQKRAVPWALAAAAGIAVLDLRVIGRWFPEVRALAFGPQLADHLAWGATLGVVLQWRRRRRRLIATKRIT